MNRLPEHRRALNGRTWGRQWNPADMDPISHYRQPGHPAAAWLLAVAIGVALAIVLVKWIDWSLT